MPVIQGDDQTGMPLPDEFTSQPAGVITNPISAGFQIAAQKSYFHRET
jgi:hypothetical protein